jgi:hypothetical protein
MTKGANFSLSSSVYEVFTMKNLLSRVGLISKLLLFSSGSLTGIVSHPGASYAVEFPEAQYPYAKAPNGCGPTGIFGSSPTDVRDTWGSVRFTEACNSHDRCYYTIDAGWNNCNRRFYSDLRTACERDVPRIPFTKIPEPTTLSACYGIASAYYVAVQGGVAAGVYKDAQNLQRSYQRWLTSQGISVPTSTTSSKAREDQYLVGDWDGDGKDNLAVRRGNCVLMDFNFDGSHEREQCYGNSDSESQYLVGDWDGDGKDNLAVRRSGTVLMDFNFDGSHEREQSYGNG